ncbi:MAG: hypothetical protein ACRDIY_19255 [Chloroflexota bacterium]
MPLVIGLFDSAANAALCLDNLAEADFRPGVTSLVMKTRADAEAIADLTGPLTGLSAGDVSERLASLGVSASDADRYARGVLAGGALIAVDAEDADAARSAAEMLGDAKARLIRTVGGPTDRGARNASRA